MVLLRQLLGPGVAQAAVVDEGVGWVDGGADGLPAGGRVHLDAVGADQADGAMD